MGGPTFAYGGYTGPILAQIVKNGRKNVFFAFFRPFAHLPRSTERRSRLKLSPGARKVAPKVGGTPYYAEGAPIVEKTQKTRFFDHFSGYR